ncbi:MAG: 16S rRNA (cytosine(967)-C(5))-methyltransferase RsmB [Rhodocyclaceae bacterium]|jgi:16S rRNA (cytosine967-C5)-methyltransferase|nr:16S rRNA (cytosine(967)-C(5))-methyltransferase RsmB [Rhodocyclaceae bacterium]
MTAAASLPIRHPPLSRALAAAARAVAEVLAGRTPEAALAAAADEVRPAARDLAFNALRDFGRGDFLLARLLSRPLKDQKARALLLTALSRLERRPEEAHTLVDQAVEAAARPFKGLTNAVLRNFQRRRAELVAAADADEVASFRHPRWWLDLLRVAYPDHWQEIAAAGNGHPPMTLRLNARCRLASADFLARLAETGAAGRALDETAILLDCPMPVERIPGFREGCVSVQDWGAQQAVRLLAAQDGMRVLDACAAPGGKAAHLLERHDLELTALEADERRARRIDENLVRLGLAAQVITGDARRPANWWDGRPFARILADVPCSASGVARRHPDIKWLRRAADVAAFAQTQAAILDALWPLLVPGGKMLYCTCSVFPAENGEQVRAFVARHPDARRLPTGGELPELQLLPTALHDGFYYALLEKCP